MVQMEPPANEVERVAASLWCRLNCWQWPEIDRDLRDKVMIGIVIGLGGGPGTAPLGILKTRWVWNHRAEFVGEYLVIRES